jgi:hypothetical protein
MKTAVMISRISQQISCQSQIRCWSISCAIENY